MKQTGSTRPTLSTRGKVTLLLILLLILLVAGAGFLVFRTGHLPGIAMGATGNGRNNISSSGKEIGDDLRAQLNELAQTDGRAQKILDNLDEFSADLVRLALQGGDALQFVADYPEKKGTTESFDLSDQADKGEVPLLLQWDSRWGYHSYGSDVIGTTGCGPVCLSMAAIYLKQDASCDPVTVADYAMSAGYYDPGAGTSWSLISEGSRHFGLSAEELPLDKGRITAALDEGKVVICAMGPGDFTTAGHFILLHGYEDGAFLVNDPNSPARSEQTWSYETISPQIRNLWALSAD